MAATTDFLHDEAIIDAVLAQFRDHLPATWLSSSDDFYGLKRIEFGDLRDYDRERDETLADNLPAVFVRMDRSTNRVDAGGLGGKQAVSHPIRIVHVWTDEQCVNSADTEEKIQPARSKMQRAKILNKPLFVDTTRRLDDTPGAPILTTDDASAMVLEVEFVDVLYEGVDDIEVMRGIGLHALAIDIDVSTRTQ